MSIFNNARVIHIVTFDFPEFDFDKNMEILKNSRILGVKPYLEKRKFNRKIYAKEYVKRSPKFLHLDLKINRKFIEAGL